MERDEPAGTTLAVEPGVRENFRPFADALWRKQRDRYFLDESKPTMKATLVAGLAVELAVIGVLVHAGYPTWRILALASIYVAFAVGHRVVMRFTRNARPLCASPNVEHAFIAMNVLAQVFVVGSAALTGGVHSPFVPGTVLPAIVSLLFFGPQAVSRWMALGNALLIVAMVALPSDITGPALPGAEYAVAILIGLCWHLLMLHMMVGKLSKIASRTGESMVSLREERFSDACARLHRLQSVGAKVAHELKNPLASIKGLCQLVSRAPEGERTQERLAVVASEITRMETILSEYLSFSRPLEDLSPEAIDLAALAREVVDVMSGRAEQAGVQLVVDGEAMPGHGDPRRLKEALINLVANAIEATPNGGTVTLTLRRGISAVTVEVADTGRGIATDDLERLGTPFFTTRSTGTGLGVTLALGVIAQHGGELKYTSTVGRGTSATITLPLKSETSPEPSTRAAMVEARA